MDSESQKELKADGLYWMHLHILSCFAKYPHPIAPATITYELYTDGKLSVKLSGQGPERHTYFKGMRREKLQRFVDRTLEDLRKKGELFHDQASHTYRLTSILEKLAAIPDNTSD